MGTPAWVGYGADGPLGAVGYGGGASECPTVTPGG